jgi:purine-binding chemotaxis protein CheW
MIASKEQNQFLVFTVGKEQYGIEIKAVQEIRSYEKPTLIANCPTFVKGVINLRGIIIPIFDLRDKLGSKNCIYNEWTVVIVLCIKNKTVGIVVDEVSDVLTVTDKEIHSVDKMKTILNTQYLIGLVTIGENVLQILHIDFIHNIMNN